MTSSGQSKGATATDPLPNRGGGLLAFASIAIVTYLLASPCLADESIAPAQPVLVYQVVDAKTKAPLYSIEGWNEPVANHPDQVATLTKIIFPRGNVLQQWSVFVDDDPPRLLSWGAGVRDPKGDEVASGYALVRQDAFPFLDRPLPPYTYPPEAPLAYVVTRLGLGSRRERTSMNLVLMGLSVVELQVWVDGHERVTVPAGTFNTHVVRMRVTADSLFPNLPGFVRRFASFFIPTQTVWLTENEPQRLVKFVGQMGPPGSPDLLIQLANVVERETGEK